MDAIVVCCGTGGFLSGVSIACKAVRPNIKIYGAEPIMADDAARSFKAGKRITLTGLTFDF